MNVPLVSVKTITYNHEPYIRNCIEGVLMQKTNFKFEYIIGEDCSTDNTRAIVKEYAEKYPGIIRFIFSNENVGGKENSRRVRDACKGKYQVTCEGDDYWIDPLKLQKQVDFMEKNLDYGLVYTDYLIYSEVLKRLDDKSVYSNISPPSGNVLIDLVLKNFIPTVTVMFRSALYKEIISERKDIKRGWLMGDYPLWLEFARISKIGFLKDVTSVYRKNINSASNFNSYRKKFDFQLSRYDCAFYYCKEFDLPSDVYLKLQSSYNLTKLKYSFYLMDRDLFREAEAYYKFNPKPNGYLMYKLGGRIWFLNRFFRFLLTIRRYYRKNV